MILKTGYTSDTDHKVFYIRLKGGSTYIAIGSYDASDGYTICSCYVSLLSGDLVYSDRIVIFSKTNNIEERRSATKSEEDYLYSTIRNFGLKWNNKSGIVEVDLSAVKDRFNIDTTDPFLDLDEGYLKLIKPQAFKL